MAARVLLLVLLAGVACTPGFTETCDEGPDNSDAKGSSCRLDCTFCGDEIVNGEHGETCDDGPANSDDEP